MNNITIHSQRDFLKLIAISKQKQFFHTYGKVYLVDKPKLKFLTCCQHVELYHTHEDATHLNRQDTKQINNVVRQYLVNPKHVRAYIIPLYAQVTR